VVNLGLSFDHQQFDQRAVLSPQVASGKVQLAKDKEQKQRCCDVCAAPE
jgi:hypothetical protein